ncbi:MAG: MFS transporter [Treponema sp.]|nr:MFS transporter [Treponema sp.]
MGKVSRLLFLILFGTMFLFGYIENIKGVSYPLIKTDFGISYERQGVMVSVLSLSYVLFCLVGGIILGRFGVKKAFITGFVFMILGLGGVFFLGGFLPVASALFVVSASFGLFEVSINALATQIFTSRAALLMSLLHFFYGAGSSVSPRVAGALAAPLGWRMVYLLSIPLVLIFFIFSLFTRFPRQEETEQEKTGVKKAGFLTALKTPMVWVFSIALGLMVTVEISSVNWAGLYFQDVYHLDPKTRGAAFVSIFFVLFTISRLLSGFAIEKIGYMRSLFIAALAAFCVFFLGFVLGARGIYVLPVLGFFVAVFWPTAMAVAMGYFREDAPVMTGAIIVIAGALNSGIQFLIGVINRTMGPAWGYRSCLFYALLTVASLVAVRRYMRHPYKSRAAAGT